jgi:hypothetical protein
MQTRGLPSDNPLQKQYIRCLDLRNAVEENVINQSATQTNQIDSGKISESQEAFDDAMDAFKNKERRLTYFNDEHQFIWFLTDLSSRLRAYPLGSIRTQRMRSEVEKLNEFIPTGVYIPCCWMNEPHYRVVRIVSGESCVFSTKERVPYLVFLETVKSPFTVSKPVISNRHENSHVLQTTTQELKQSRQENPTIVANTNGEILEEHAIQPKKALDDKQKQYLLSLKVVDSNMKSSKSLNNMEQLLEEGESEEDREKKLRDEEFERDFKDFVEREQHEKVKKLIEEVREKMSEAEAERRALLYACYGESFDEKRERIRKSSPFGHLEGWTTQAVIVKANDDIRQEHFAMQLINVCKKIFDEEGVPVYIRPYHVITTDRDSGMIECCTDTISLDGLKKKFPNFTTLNEYFKAIFGEPGTPAYKKAQMNWVEAMAGYSAVSYILQIKDRHNGNLMLHRDGHIIHIDFGFFLGNSPGAINFESAPFKLTSEMVEVMGGVNDPMFKNYCMLVFLGLKCLAKRKQEVLSLVEMMSSMKFPCFEAGPALVLRELNSRFHSDLSEKDFAKWAKR